VAGFYLNTGRDPAAGVPRCWSWQARRAGL